MNQLPTGMYQPGNSMLHKMKASIKILCFLLLTIVVVTTDTIWGYVLLFLVSGILICAAKIHLKTAFGFVSRLAWFLTFIFILNTCFYGPENPWIKLWIFAPSFEGLMQGANIVVRVVLMLLLSNVLMVTTTPLAMTEGIEKLLSPLHVIRIPVEQVAMILSVAMQFIPTLFEEADMIKKAQIARGARFDSKRLRDKAGAVMPLIVPIFLAAFKRADELSLAMEARGYRTDKRKRKEEKNNEQNDNR